MRVVDLATAAGEIGTGWAPNFPVHSCSGAPSLAVGSSVQYAGRELFPGGHQPRRQSRPHARRRLREPAAVTWAMLHEFKAREALAWFPQRS